MNPLESRKQLLIAESELNRAQLMDDLGALRADVHAFADRAKTFGAVASSAATLAMGLTAFRRGWRDDAGNCSAKPSWLRSIVNGASMVSTFWLAFRSRGRDKKEN